MLERDPVHLLGQLVLLALCLCMASNRLVSNLTHGVSFPKDYLESCMPYFLRSVLVLFRASEIFQCLLCGIAGTQKAHVGGMLWIEMCPGWGALKGDGLYQVCAYISMHTYPASHPQYMVDNYRQSRYITTQPCCGHVVYRNKDSSKTRNRPCFPPGS